MSFIEKYMNYVAPLRGSEKIHRITAYSLLAACLERRVWLPLETFGAGIYPNLYCLVIARPGVVRKSYSIGVGKKLLKEMYNKPTFAPDVFSPAALILKFLKATKSFTWQNKAYEYQALYLHISELGYMFRDIGGGHIVMDLIEYYDCADELDKGTRTHGEESPRNICLNMLAATTPTFLEKELPQSSANLGLISRFILVHEPDWPEVSSLPTNDLERLARQEKQRIGLILTLERIMSLCGQVIITPDAAKWYDSWFHEQHQPTIRSCPPREQLLLSRRNTHILKLGILNAVSRNATLVVEKDDFINALQFWNTLEPEMHSAFGVRTQYRNVNIIDDVFKAFTALGQKVTTVNELKQWLEKQGQHYLGGFNNDFEKACFALHEMGKLRIQQTTKGLVLFPVNQEKEPK